jgi:hypothetical protein
MHIFRILKFDDIKDVEFSSDPNGIRNARRIIFIVLHQKLEKRLKAKKSQRSWEFSRHYQLLKWVIEID